ncbi:hypothetical protein LCGC14_3156770, partial [marine sediment metagenome]
AREILGKVTKAEPAWRPAPAMMRTVNDIIRMSLRDLRGSQNLFRLAQGNGTLDDLDSLTKWADEISDRVGKTQKVIAQHHVSYQSYMYLNLCVNGINIYLIH